MSYRRLRETLEQAAQRAFAQLQQRHPGHRFYVIALYTDTDALSVGPTANSEEALTDEELRWSPCDWPFHLEGQEHFEAAQARDSSRWHYGERWQPRSGFGLSEVEER